MIFYFGIYNQKKVWGFIHNSRLLYVFYTCIAHMCLFDFTNMLVVMDSDLGVLGYTECIQRRLRGNYVEPGHDVAHRPPLAWVAWPWLGVGCATCSNARTIFEFSLSSDDEAFFPTLVTGIARYLRRKRQASVKKTRKTINRDRAAPHDLLVGGRGRRGFSTYQKVSAALRLIATGQTSDSTDDYIKMADRTSREYTYLFAKYVIELYGHIYLRRPTKSDVEELYVAHHAAHGFPGMLGSLDCTHWAWENCPSAWR
ncbi:hypothetical protein L1887_22877 [Cichorium endivia]|nr:hypothetical protein L1887_22877 [Cichorium endivia]